MTDTDKAFTAEAPEVRDADEIAEHKSRHGNFSGGWPCMPDGTPMAKVTGACSDKIPTVQFGNVVIGPVMIERFVDPTDAQGIIDEGRKTQRWAEFIVGAERRLLQWALDPASKIASPVTGQDAFASPPPGYDKTKLPDPQASPLGPPVSDPQAVAGVVPPSATQGDAGTPTA